MKTGASILLLAAVFLSSRLVYARDDGGEKYKAPPEIIATLPKICWWRYMDNIPNTAEYNIHDCGGYTNHYCPGLVNMKLAEREHNVNRAMIQWRSAKGNMEYTLHWTKEYPECSIRQSAKSNLQRINLEIEMLKYKKQGR
jgi:hypothetical protein